MKSKCTRSSISRTSFFTPCTRIVRFCYNVFRRPGFMPVINEYHGASSKQLLQKSVPVSMLRIFRAGTGTATLELWHMLWGCHFQKLTARISEGVFKADTEDLFSIGTELPCRGDVAVEGLASNAEFFA